MFQNINPLAKSTAVTEILIMLLGTFILGYLIRHFMCKMGHLGNSSKKVENKNNNYVPTSSNKSANTSAKDDLKKVEGIGPAIEKLLNAEGVMTFSQLADTPLNRIKSILDAAGPQFQIHDGGTWAEQARLARDGKWAEFQKLTEELKGGKKA